MTNFLVPVTVNILPQISDLEGKQGMFILPDGSINVNRKNGTWMIINKQSDHAGIIKPSDDISVQPGVAKWYWAGEGIYQNAGGLIIDKQGILSYDGSVWKELELDIPEVKVSPEFDPTTNTEPQGGMQIAARYDKGLKALKTFVELGNFQQITMKNNSATVPKIDGTYLDNPNSHSQEIIIPTGYNKLRFKGYPVQVGNISLYACILASKNDGTFDVLVSPEPDIPQSIKELEVDIPAGTEYVIVSWNNYQSSLGSIPEVYLYSGETVVHSDTVKIYIDEKLDVLKWFLEQKETIDAEQPISISGFKAGVLENTNTFVVDAGNKCMINVDVLDYNKFYFKGFPSVTGAAGVDTYATLLGIKSNGQISVIKKAVISSFNANDDQQAVIDFEIDITAYKKLSIGWSNWGIAAGKNPDIKLIKTSPLTSKIDLVKDYIDHKIPKDTSVFTQKASITLPEANYNINIIGDLPSDITPSRTATDVVLDFKLGERTIVSINASMSIQGQASVNWSKKNFAIDFKNSFGEKLVLAFGDRVSTDGYVLKSQYADTSKIVEQVGCNIWHSMRTSGEFPDNRIDNQPIDTALTAKEEIINEEGAKFFTYGFPVNLYYDGVLMGVYILRLKKGRNNYRFVSSNKKHIFLDFDYTLPGNAGMSEMLDFNTFKPYQWEVRNPKLSGYSAGGTINDAAVMTPISNLWAWTSAIYNNTLVNINDYTPVANLNAWIDYYLTSELVFHYDGLDNNILLGSWDGAHFSPLLYDCDGIFGMGPEILNITGKIVNNSNVRGRIFWQRFSVYYSNQIKARYIFLKSSGIISMSKFQNIVQEQGSKITSEMIKADNANWGYLDVVKKSPQSILIFLKNRLAYLDSQFL